MSLTKQIAKHFREVHFGGNWTCSNLKDQLSDISWQQATTQVHSLNTIVALLYHTNYFVSAAIRVFQGEPINAHDKFSFDHPPIHSQDEWNNLIDKALTDAEKFANLIEKMPENMLWEKFEDEKYGNYYRNIHGIIEHTHYHLGQIVIIKKLLEQEKSGNNRNDL